LDGRVAETEAAAGGAAEDAAARRERRAKLLELRATQEARVQEITLERERRAAEAAEAARRAERVRAAAAHRLDGVVGRDSSRVTQATTAQVARERAAAKERERERSDGARALSYAAFEAGHRAVPAWRKIG
jgi:hypothetical protein